MSKGVLPDSPPAASPLFDLQINGFAGVDFQSQPTLADVRRACEALRFHETHWILATFVTDTPEAFLSKLEAFEDYRRSDALVRETVVGYHLEGPYLSAEPGFRGAHPGTLMKDPEEAEFDRWQSAAGGNIRLVTLAPERKGAVDFIAALKRRKVAISLGHTNASDRDIDQAISAGATLCTHLGNGCPMELPRHDNVVQRLLARDELTASFIPDGVHLPPFVLRNLFRAKPKGKVILTTDAMAAAGSAPGRYRLGPLEVEVGPDGVVRQPGARNFAGSSLTPDQGVRNASSWLGVSPQEARILHSQAVVEALGMHRSDLV